MKFSTSFPLPDFAVLYDGNETVAAVWAQILQTIFLNSQYQCLNTLLIFESQMLSYKRVTEFGIVCFVNKA